MTDDLSTTQGGAIWLKKNQLHKIYRSKNVAQAMLKQLQSNNSTKFKNAYTSSIEISEIKEEYK